jgi:hypothetical protein
VWLSFSHTTLSSRRLGKCRTRHYHSYNSHCVDWLEIYFSKKWERRPLPKFFLMFIYKMMQKVVRMTSKMLYYEIHTNIKKKKNKAKFKRRDQYPKTVRLLGDHVSIIRFNLKSIFLIYLFYIMNTSNFIYKFDKTLFPLTSTNTKTTFVLTQRRRNYPSLLAFCLVLLSSF